MQRSSFRAPKHLGFPQWKGCRWRYKFHFPEWKTDRRNLPVLENQRSAPYRLRGSHCTVTICLYLYSSRFWHTGSAPVSPTCRDMPVRLWNQQVGRGWPDKKPLPGGKRLSHVLWDQVAGQSRTVTFGRADPTQDGLILFPGVRDEYPRPFF